MTTYRVVGCPVVLPAADELARGAEFSDDGRDPRLTSLVAFWRRAGAIVAVAAPAVTAASAAPDPEITDGEE